MDRTHGGSTDVQRLFMAGVAWTVKTGIVTDGYPLVNEQLVMENHHFSWINQQKSTISMAMFKKKLLNSQRVFSLVVVVGCCCWGVFLLGGLESPRRQLLKVSPARSNWEIGAHCRKPLESQLGCAGVHVLGMSRSFQWRRA